MAEPSLDPREVGWHPRLAASVIGQDHAHDQFMRARAGGKLHHAWLLQGPKGTGKATLAYNLATENLGHKAWIESRSHPDLFVLERQMNDAKPPKLKAEIAVDDARGLAHFLSRTSTTGNRVVIVDSADDLNAESGNAILKLVEEPPANVTIFLINHQPGKILRTLKSRCIRLSLNTLSNADCMSVINTLPLDNVPEHEALLRAVEHSGGSPGQALNLLSSIGAESFSAFAKNRDAKISSLNAIAAKFGGRGLGQEEFVIFNNLLLQDLSVQAKVKGAESAATIYAKISENIRIVIGYNLDRKQAALDHMLWSREALKQA